MSSLDPGAGVGAPGGSSPLPTGSGVPGSPPDGSAAGSPPAGTIDWNTAPQQLRDAYQRTQSEYQQTKTRLEPWERIGARPEDVTRSHQTYTKLYTEAVALGRQFNFDEAAIQAYFQEDPVGTLQELRRAAQQQSGQEKPLTRAEAERIAEQKLKDGLKPFQQEREQRMDQEAESRFDGEFDRQFKTGFPNGLPDSNKEALQGLAWQLLLDNKDAYTALRGKADVSHVAAAFEQAKKTFLKIVSDYAEHDKKRIGGIPPSPLNGQQLPGNRKPRSLEDIAAALNDESIPLDHALGR